MKRILLIAAAGLVLVTSQGAQTQEERRGGAAGALRNLGGKPDHNDHDQDPAGRDAIRIGTNGDGSFREGIDGFDPGMDGWDETLETLKDPGAGPETRTRADAAEDDVERLLDTYERNRARIAAANQREAERVRNRWRDLNARWRDMATATRDGEVRRPDAWRGMLDDTRDPGPSNAPSSPTTPVSPDPASDPTPNPASDPTPGPARPPAPRDPLQPPPPPIVPTNEEGLPIDLVEAGGLDQPGPELPANAPATPPEDPATVDPDFAEPDRDGERNGLRPDLAERVDGLGPDRRPTPTVPTRRDDVRDDRDLVDEDLADLIEAVRNGERPSHIPPPAWAALSDRLEKEIADLESDGAAAETDLRERIDGTLEPLENAIRDAREDFDRELDAEEGLEDLTPEEREARDRDRAARRRAAEYSEARDRFREAVERFRESQGEASERDVSHATGGGLGGAWEKMGAALQNISRMMDTSGRPGPPPVDRWEGDGLPLPDWMRVNDTTDRIKAKIIAYAEELRGVIHDIQNIHDVILREDRRKVRNTKALLWYRDFQRWRHGHPLYQAYRRRDIRNLIRDLNATRSERTARRLTELQRRGEYLVNELAVDVERLGTVEPADLAHIEGLLPEGARVLDRDRANDQPAGDD